ncbi:MAG: sugar phosphate isomerase/epimerase family protein [Acidobacteriota bacterium]
MGDRKRDEAKITRRRLVQAGALALGTAVVNRVPKGAPAPEAKAGLASAAGTPQGIHLSLAAYSMRQALLAGEMDLFDFIDWCADLGLAGTELTSYYFEKGFGRPYLHRLQLRAFHRGVTISGTAVRNNFCLPPGARREKEIDHVKRWIDHAAECLAPHIRIFGGPIPPGVSRDQAIGWVADSIQEVLDYASNRAVVLGLENHGGITARAVDHLAICDRVGEHPHFGINLDTGNYRTDPYRELALAAGRAVNVQFKVQVYRGGSDKVPADFERVRRILLEANYRGWLALEYEAEGDPHSEIPKHLDRLKQLFGPCT